VPVRQQGLHGPPALMRSKRLIFAGLIVCARESGKPAPCPDRPGEAHLAVAIEEADRSLGIGRHEGVRRPVANISPCR